MLPGGADKTSSEASSDSEAIKWADSKNFHKFVGSLSLTNTEMNGLIDSLSDI